MTPGSAASCSVGRSPISRQPGAPAGGHALRRSLRRRLAGQRPAPADSDRPRRPPRRRRPRARPVAIDETHVRAARASGRPSGASTTGGWVARSGGHSRRACAADLLPLRAVARRPVRPRAVLLGAAQCCLVHRRQCRAGRRTAGVRRRGKAQTTPSRARHSQRQNRICTRRGPLSRTDRRAPRRLLFGVRRAAFRRPSGDRTWHRSLARPTRHACPGCSLRRSSRLPTQ